MKVDILAKKPVNPKKQDNNKFDLVSLLLIGFIIAYAIYELRIRDDVNPSPVTESTSSIMFVTKEGLSVKQKLVVNSQVIQQKCDDQDINFRVYPFDAETNDIESWASNMLEQGIDHAPCLVVFNNKIIQIFDIPDNIDQVLKYVK